MLKSAEERKTENSFWMDVANQIRSIRRIDLRIHQLQKQRYLGITSLYNKIMRKIYPNYDEYSQLQKIKFKRGQNGSS